MNPSRVCIKLRDYCDSHKSCDRSDFVHFCKFEGINTDGNRLGDSLNEAYLQIRSQKRRY